MAYQEVSGEPFLFTLEWWRKARRLQFHKTMAMLFQTMSAMAVLILLWTLCSAAYVGVGSVEKLGEDRRVEGLCLWFGVLVITHSVGFWYHSRNFCHKCGNDFDISRPRHIYYTFSADTKRIGMVSLCTECTTSQDEEMYKRPPAERRWVRKRAG